MATIDGGTLSFTSELDNDQLKQAIDETIARVQGLSDASVAGGAQMAAAYAQAAQEVRARIGEVGKACEEHENAINALTDKYNQLGARAAQAFKSGRDAEARAIQEQQRAIQGEIKVRESLLAEMREQSNVLETEAQKMESNAQAANDNANAHQSMRARIRELKEELVEMEMAGQRNTEAYRNIQMEVANLTDAWSDASQQANYLANDEAGFQGVMSGLTGLTGGFQAASSAVSLFAGENENLQAAMLKVQQLMSITQGLQAVSQALNKDSYFQLVTLAGIREWWNKVVAAGTGEQIADTAATTADTIAKGENTAAETANTAATTANTAAKAAQSSATLGNTTATAANAVAQGVQNTTAVAGTAANIGLAGAFRMVGAAIKSIPVFGWIAAGISAIIAVISHFAGKANEAKEAAEKFYKGVAENAYKPIGTIMELSQAWTALGDNIEAKSQFIEENRAEFDSLGVSIQGVTDAENLLVANKDAFIDAQIEKAKAAVYLQEAEEKIKELIAAEQELENMPDTIMQWVQMTSDGAGFYQEVHNEAKDDCAKKIAELRQEIEDGYTNAAIAEKEGWNKLHNAGIEGTKTYVAGSLGAIENAIKLKQDALKQLTNNDDYKAAMAEIIELQRQAAAITGKPVGGVTGGGGGGSSFRTHRTGGGGGGSSKDPFKERLEKMKQEYTCFQKWMNSGDDILVNSAKQEFANILKQGATYIDYLKNQREQILAIDVAGRTKEQNRQLRELNNAIAEETKSAVLQAFNDELNNQLTNARTILEQLRIIDEMRKELAGDGTELDDAKKDALDDAADNVRKQLQQETEQLLENYAGYVERKRRMEQEFQDDIALMERARLNATTDEQRANIDAAIANRRAQYAKDSKSSGDADYDELLETYRSYEQRRVDIAAEYDEKIAKAREHENDDLVKELQAAKAKDLLGVSFDELKASPEYAEAFTDLENVSTETLRSLVARFEECKLAVGDALNPQDLAEFGEKLNSIVDELNKRDPFTTIKQGYAELEQAQRELRAAEADLARVRASGIGGKEEENAVRRVNAAKDKYIKKNNEVKKAQKVVRDSISQLCAKFNELGGIIGGEAGEILNIIGDIGTFTLAAMEGVEQASKTSSNAIKAVEKASVILAIISAALQVAQKLMNLFGGDGGQAEYEKAAKVYERYIAVLDDVIAKQKELIASMSDVNARNSYEYAMEMLEKASNAARELGKQYLNAGAGMFSHSHGVKQRQGISLAAWEEWIEFAKKYNISMDAVSGRMTGLFDLTAEELLKLREEAPLFFASLHEETQDYLNQIIDSIGTAEELRKTLNESFTGVDYESFESDFIDMLSDMESSAKDFAKSFQEYMRKALILQMFKSQFKKQLEEYYDMWARALDPDGTGGSDITSDEQAALNALQNSIITGARAAADKINEQFGVTDADESLTGAVSGVSEETASLVAGQMNAIRINQLESAEIMRNSLLQLNAIVMNTEYCRHLAKIDRVISLLEGADETTLRSQGLTT